MNLTNAKLLYTLNLLLKDLGELKYFLGLEVVRSSQAIVISQAKYVSDILKDVGMLHCKPTSFPLPQSLYLTSDCGDLFSDSDIYRILLGRLLYINLTRLGISYAIQHFSQFMSMSKKPHCEATLHVLGYLKGILTQGLYLPVTDAFHLTTYCDSNWTSCFYSRKSF